MKKLARLYVPHPRCFVHGPRDQHSQLGNEAHYDHLMRHVVCGAVAVVWWWLWRYVYLGGVPLQCVNEATGLRIPQPRCVVEAPSRHQVPVAMRVAAVAYTVHHVVVSVEDQRLVRLIRPDLVSIEPCIHGRVEKSD